MNSEQSHGPGQFGSFIGTTVPRRYSSWMCSWARFNSPAPVFGPGGGPEGSAGRLARNLSALPNLNIAWACCHCSSVRLLPRPDSRPAIAFRSAIAWLGSSSIAFVSNAVRIVARHAETVRSRPFGSGGTDRHARIYAIEQIEVRGGPVYRRRKTRDLESSAEEASVSGLAEPRRLVARKLSAGIVVTKRCRHAGPRNVVLHGCRRVIGRRANSTNHSISHSVLLSFLVSARRSALKPVGKFCAQLIKSHNARGSSNLTRRSETLGKIESGRPLSGARMTALRRDEL